MTSLVVNNNIETELSNNLQEKILPKLKKDPYNPIITSDKKKELDIEIEDIPKWRSQLKVGDSCDALDSVNFHWVEPSPLHSERKPSDLVYIPKWFESKVVDVRPEGPLGIIPGFSDELRVHFHGWSPDFDEWIPRMSKRIQPRFTKVPDWRSQLKANEGIEYKYDPGGTMKWFEAVVKKIDLAVEGSERVYIKNKLLERPEFSCWVLLNSERLMPLYTHLKNPKQSVLDLEYKYADNDLNDFSTVAEVCGKKRIVPIKSMLKKDKLNSMTNNTHEFTKDVCIYDLTKVYDIQKIKNIKKTLPGKSGFNTDSYYSYSSSNNIYKYLLQQVNFLGTISPAGDIINTPDDIKLPLKIHQKRTLYEMVKRENNYYRLVDSYNTILLCDNVGSGKSLEILSLIAHKPVVKNLWSNKYFMPDINYKKPEISGFNYCKKNIINFKCFGCKVKHPFYLPYKKSGQIHACINEKSYCEDCIINNDVIKKSDNPDLWKGIEKEDKTCELSSCMGVQLIEFSSNLLIVPHNIYHQWINYIKTYTNLTYYGVDKRIKMKDSWSENYILNLLNSYQIICVKSTMYKHFISVLNYKFNNGFTSSYRSPNSCFKTEEYENLDKKTEFISKDTFMSSFKSNYNKFYTKLKNADNGDNLNQLLQQYTKKLKKWSSKINYEQMDKNKFIEHTRYNTSIRYGYIFQRIIVDEVDSITVPAFPYAPSKFIWLVTSSINNLLYPHGKKAWSDKYNGYRVISTGIRGTGFLKDVVTTIVGNKNTHSKNGFRVFSSLIRNNLNFIKQSITIPNPEIQYTECFTPDNIRIASNALSSSHTHDKKILDALNANDMETAKSLLGATAGTEDDIIELINKKLYKNREELEEKLKTREKDLLDTTNSLENLKKIMKSKKIKIDLNKQKLESLNILNSDESKKINDENVKLEVDYDILKIEKNKLVSNKNSIKKSIELYKKNLKDVNYKIDGITSRIEGSFQKDCPICTSTVNNPCITNCCNQVFCLECLGMAIQYSPKKECPMCRATINMKKLKMVLVKPNNKINKIKDECKEKQLPEKDEVVINFIKNNPNKRILIFSDYNNSFKQLSTKFTNENIKFSEISGSSDRIKNIINRFKSCEFQVLLLNAKKCGAGLNLQFTDHIIIYHRMSKDLEKQVIGRAQRLGRTEPLYINYLCYENEYPDLNNKKNDCKKKS